MVERISCHMVGGLISGSLHNPVGCVGGDFWVAQTVWVTNCFGKQSL